MRRVQELSARDYSQYYTGTVVFKQEQGALHPLYVQLVQEYDDGDYFECKDQNNETVTVRCNECFVVLPDTFVTEQGEVLGSSTARDYKKGLYANRSQLRELFRAVNLRAPKKFWIHQGSIMYLGNLVGFVSDGVNYLADEVLVQRFKKETYQEAVCLP